MDHGVGICFTVVYGFNKLWFNYIKNCQTISQSGCTILYSCQQYMSSQLLQFFANNWYRQPLKS